MTVKELIDELNEIENKNLTICTTTGYREVTDVDHVFIEETKVTTSFGIERVAILNLITY